MADLGDIIGSFMTGVIRARRMSDENTAALAEYYRSNPLLEGLSVPRIRIMELTIDLPVLINDLVEGEAGKMEDPAKIATAAGSQLKSTLTKNNIVIESTFQAAFLAEAKTRLAALQESGGPVVKEAVTRAVQDAFADSLAKKKVILSASDKEVIAKDLRHQVSQISHTKEAVTSSIVSNIKTADVKDKASPTSVVRLKITLKEEGLEWATQAHEGGGVVRTLQPE